MSTLTEIAYTAGATSRASRSGHVSSPDGALDLDLGWPGRYDGEPRANPEMLFAAAYAADFQGSLENRGKTVGVDTSDSTVTAQVSFGRTDDGGFGLSVELLIHVPGLSPEATVEVAELAHQFCPFSKAVLGNINVTLSPAPGPEHPTASPSGE